MTAYTCELLQKEITFFQNQIQSCCFAQLGPVYFENYRGEKIDWNDVLQTKLSSLQALSEGEFPSKCKGCLNLKKIKKEDFAAENIQKKFSRIIISHWVHCNCSCVYCARQEFSDNKVTRTPKKSDFYDFLPILESMYENNILDTDGNLFVDFQGGDISVLSEFDDIMQKFMDNNVGFIRFTTNNIVYQPKIAEMLKNRKAELMTSLDCGSRETYKKLKRVNKFDDTVGNLKRYKETAPDGFYFVKYITVKGINDNVEEVNKFIDLMAEIKIPTVSFELDFRDIMMQPYRRFEIPKHYYDLRDIFINRCKEENLNLVICPYTQQIFKQGFFGQN